MVLWLSLVLTITGPMRKFIRHPNGYKFYEVIRRVEGNRYTCATSSGSTTFFETSSWPVVDEIALAAARLLHGKVTVNYNTNTQSED